MSHSALISIFPHGCNRWKLSYGIVVSYFVFSVIASGVAAAQTKTDYSAADVIARINEVYMKTVSAKGKISRVTDFGEGDPDRSDGAFSIQKPDRLLVVFGGTSPRTAVFDGSTYHLYFPNENRGYYTDAANLTTGQRYVISAGPFFGNIIQSMSNTFAFDNVYLYEGNLVINALPVGESPYSYVLIGVSPDTWTIRIVEYFDEHDAVVRQIRYLSFKSADGGIFFPTTVETTTLVAGHIMTETVYLTDISLNCSIGDDEFKVPGSKDTRWVPEPFEMKR